MSQTQDASQLKTLPLHQEHERAGAKFGAFGEWFVPLYYTSILAEHQTVRSGVGVFDISHMGEFWVRGREAGVAINPWITNDVTKITNGQALYSPVCRENGGIADDVVVMCEDPQNYLIVVNAANIEKDFAWFQSHLSGDVSLENKSDETALLAVQGPKSRAVLERAFRIDLAPVSYYHFIREASPFGSILISRTGYTGELGYEIFLPVGQAPKFWKHLFEIGKPFGLKPVGFGARDTLRLEARFNLYGHDMTDETTPLEAGVGWTVAWNKKDFIGKRALEVQKAEGLKRKLVGFEMVERGVARDGCRVFVNGKPAGHVTSGTFSPTLKRNIGLAYIAAEYSNIGQEFQIEIRDKLLKAQVVKTPFYRSNHN